MSPAATAARNCARPGAGSDPVNPPIAITAVPLASSRPAALCADTVAAQRVVEAESSVASSVDENPRRVRQGVSDRHGDDDRARASRHRGTRLCVACEPWGTPDECSLLR